MLRRVAITVLASLGCLLVKAQGDLPEDFVTASVLFTEPGGSLYSRAGHVAIRMQCPTHNLDFVFSYESEDASKKVLKFLAGELKMGLFAIPPEEYLSSYRDEGRKVTEYVLSLPISVKQNLWRILDNHLAEGIDIPYDYLERGCAQSTLQLLKEGLAPGKIKYGPWPESFSLTRREITGIQMKRYPWTWAFLNLIVNGSIDSVCSYEKKVIMPSDLVEVLKAASFEGRKLVETEGVVIAGCEEGSGNASGMGFTPLHLSLILLFLTLLCVCLRKSWMDIPLLGIQTVLGAISLYLVAFSTLPCTQWSWLLIPFNPLPLLLWKWRRRWALPYAAVCLGWALTMLLLRHPVTDPPYAVLSIALALCYVQIWRLRNARNQLSSHLEIKER